MLSTVIFCAEQSWAVYENEKNNRINGKHNGLKNIYNMLPKRNHSGAL